MNTSLAQTSKILSGIDAVDQTWGGLYRGGSYLVYGRMGSGRGLLTLTFTQTGVLLDERCLYVSPRRPKDLTIQSSTIGFDLRQAYDSGLVKLVRIPTPFALRALSDDDLAKALRDLATLVKHHAPDRLVINDFMPFVQFDVFDRFCSEYLHLLEELDTLQTTLLVVMAEPANEASQRVIDFMQGQMTGALHLEMTDDATSTNRRLWMLPTIGHIHRRVVEPWDLEAFVQQSTELSSRLPQLRAVQEEAEAPAAPDQAAYSPPVGDDAVPAEPVLHAIRLGSRPPTPAPVPEPQPEAAPAVSDAEPSEAAEAVEAAETAEPATAEANPGVQAVALGAGQKARPASRPAFAIREAFSAPAAAPAAAEAPAAEAPAAEAPAAEAPAAEAPAAEAPAAEAPAEAAEQTYTPEADDADTEREADDADTERAAAAALATEEQAFAEEEPAAAVDASPEDDFAPHDGAQHASDRTPEASLPAFAPVGEQAGEAERDHADRDGFRDRLQQHFLRRALDNTPFLLVAMRLDRNANPALRPFDFEFIQDSVFALLRDDDDLLIDPDRERLVLLLADSRPEEAQRFFARLKNRLREETPQQADHLLHAVSAIVVPDGRPFENAEEFLNYAIDES